MSPRTHAAWVRAAWVAAMLGLCAALLAAFEIGQARQCESLRADHAPQWRIDQVCGP